MTGVLHSAGRGVLLVGASGLAREVLAAGAIGVVGIVDDDPRLHGALIDGVPVTGDIASAVDRVEKLLLCIGPSTSRRAVGDRLRLAGVGDDRFASFVAGSGRIGRSSRIGAGAIVLDGTVVTADARIGAHAVVMPNCVITHDDVLEEYATLAAGVVLGGAVTVGAAAFVGMNASVAPGRRVGSGATVGMGAVVLGDVPDGQTWAGVPARSLHAAVGASAGAGAAIPAGRAS